MKSKLLMLFILLITNVWLTAQENDWDVNILGNTQIITPSNVDQIERIAQFELEGIIDLWWSDETHLYAVTNSGNWLLDLTSGELSLLDSVDNPAERVDFYATTNLEANDYGDIIAQTVEVFSGSSDDQVTEIPVTLYDETCAYTCPVSVTFNPEQNQLVYVAQVPAVESAFVDLDTGQKTILPRQGYFNPSYSPDGEIFATFVGDAGYIPVTFYLIDTQTGTVVREIPLYGSDFAFDTSGDIIAIGRYDNTAPNPDESIGILHFYDVSELLFEGDIEPLTTLSLERPPSSIAFSIDNRFVAINENRQLSLWAIPTIEE